MIVIAPDSYKGTMSATEVCEIIKAEFLKIRVSEDVRCFPIADGGEGTVDAMLFNGGERINIKVTGPLFKEADSFYGILPDNTAVIEMAAASGLPMVGSRKNPMLTTTYGTGQLIRDALDRGCKKILIGLGGSATNDGGIGCAAALGAEFLDHDGNSVPLNGSGLAKITDINLTNIDRRLADVDIEALCDVVSPLYGKTGAAYVFAPQKGADNDTVKKLDGGLRNLAKITEKAIGRDNSKIEGAGAAGGLGFGLVSFLGARLVKGAPAVLKATGFENAAKIADLIITGEGCMDNQSLLGKAPAAVAELSGNTPVVAIVGMSKITDMSGSNIKKIYITDHDIRSFEQIIRECRNDLSAAAHRVAEDFYNRLI